MTVRAWFTISALVLLALSAAVIVRLLAPVAAPEILARVGDTRLEGLLHEACWPQRNNDLRCEKAPNPAEAIETQVPPTGMLRLIVAYPAQPKEGRILLVRGGKELVRKKDWDDDIRFTPKPGHYTVIAQADYPQKAFVHYSFAFTITPSGS